MGETAELREVKANTHFSVLLRILSVAPSCRQGVRVGTLTKLTSTANRGLFP